MAFPQPGKFLLSALLAALLGLTLIAPAAPIPPTTPAVLLPAGPAPLLAEARFSPWDLATAVAWSPDGATLAVAAGEWIRIYPVAALVDGSFSAEGQSEQAALFVDALTHSLAFSPDGSLLAAGSRDGIARVLDLSSPSTPRWSLEAHKKGVNAVAFSPLGDLLATGGMDAVARTWNLESGETVSEIIGGTFAVPGLAFQPDGEALAVINGGLVRLRQVREGRILGTFLSEASLFSVAFSPDGRLLAVGDSANGVLLWDPATAFRTGQEHYPEPRRLQGHRGQPGRPSALVWKVAFSPDGVLLASAGGDGQVIVWDVASGEQTAAWQAHTVAASLAFSPDGSLLATSGLDGALRIWRIP